MLFGCLLGNFKVLNPRVIRSIFRKRPEEYIKILISKLHFDKSTGLIYPSVKATINIPAYF